MESPLVGLGVLLVEMEDVEFVGPPKPESRRLVGTVIGGPSLTACIAMLELNRMALENLPSLREMVFITAENSRWREATGRLIFDESNEERRELIAGLLEQLSAPIVSKEILFLPREKESRLAPQLTRYGPKGYKSSSQLRRDATRLPGRRRR